MTLHARYRLHESVLLIHGRRGGATPQRKPLVKRACGSVPDKLLKSIMEPGRVGPGRALRVFHLLTMGLDLRNRQSQYLHFNSVTDKENKHLITEILFQIFIFGKIQKLHFTPRRMALVASQSDRRLSRSREGGGGRICPSPQVNVPNSCRPRGRKQSPFLCVGSRPVAKRVHWVQLHSLWVPLHPLVLRFASSEGGLSLVHRVQSEAPEGTMRPTECAIAPSAPVWLRACGGGGGGNRKTS